MNYSSTSCKETQKMDNQDIEYGTQIKVQEFICEVGDYNDDNLTESLVDIYKSKKDYNSGKILETISLSNKNIKENIKEYIEENYFTTKYKKTEKINNKTRYKERGR